MPQTYQPLTNAPYYQPSQDSGSTTINEQANKAAHAPTIVVQSVGVSTASSITSGEKVNGRAWIVGVASTPGDDFNGHSGELAMWYSGFVFRTLQVGETFWSIADRQLFFVASLAPTSYRPLNAPHKPGTEYDTGRTDGALVGPKTIYRKVVAFGAAPNNTTKNVAHGITSLPVAKGAHLFVRATISDGTTPRPIPYYDGTNKIELKIDATNIIAISNFNASGSDIIAEVEYAK